MSKSVECVCVLDTCEYTCSDVGAWWQDNHLECVRCHARQAVEANRQDSYTLSADRQTDLGTAVYVYMCTGDTFVFESVTEA